MRLRSLGSKDEQWEATASFHEAARKELLALEALEDASPEEIAGAQIEACGLFLEGHDPVSAAEAWARLPAWTFASESGAAMLERLEPEYKKKGQAFVEAWQSFVNSLPSPHGFERTTEQSIRTLLENHEGIAELWWALSLHTKSSEVAKDARERMKRLSLAPQDEALSSAAWWERINDALDAPNPAQLYVQMRSEKRGSNLLLDAVSRTATAFSELLTAFVEGHFSTDIELLPSSASFGSFTLKVAAQGLPPQALAELSRDLSSDTKRVDPRKLAELLSILQANHIELIVRADSWSLRSRSADLVIDAKRRKALLKAADEITTRTVASVDVPQANDLSRVFRVVELVSEHGDVTAERLQVTPRQVNYYRRAAKLLGFLTEADEVTAAGRLIQRLTDEDRLRASVVHFESSTCGDAWIRWSKGRTLLDVDPDTAFDFLCAKVPGLNSNTSERRAKTLATWSKTLKEYHYAP